MDYILHILIMVCVYLILAFSLNLVVGYGGMLSLCQAAFYSIGAYASTLLVTKAGWPFGFSVLASVLLSGLMAYLIAVASIRLHGDFFVLATMGYQVIIFSVLYNWIELTNGPYGISGVPKPSFFGWKVSSTGGFLVVATLSAALVWLIAWRLSHSAYGRTLQAVRDDEIAAQALGKNVQQFKRSAFAISGMLAAFAGILYAGYASYIDPTSFSIDESIFILCIVIIGGAGNSRGPILGAMILIILPEVLRLIQIPDAIAASSRQVLYGVLLVLMMRFRPQGIAGRYAFD
jgi:branched-chain amino acid transport system permease protein